MKKLLISILSFSSFIFMARPARAFDFFRPFKWQNNVLSLPSASAITPPPLKGITHGPRFPNLDLDSFKKFEKVYRFLKIFDFGKMRDGVYEITYKQKL